MGSPCLSILGCKNNTTPIYSQVLHINLIFCTICDMRILMDVLTRVALPSASEQTVFARLGILDAGFHPLWHWVASWLMQ